jgi:hypothetical protein
LANLARNGDAAPNGYHFSLNLSSNYNITKKTGDGAFLRALSDCGGAEIMSLLRGGGPRHQNQKKSHKQRESYRAAKAAIVIPWTDSAFVNERAAHIFLNLTALVAIPPIH